jgi:hypothetical protein
MSESAVKIKPFFLALLLKFAVLDTLRTAGAEDRALQGCNPSADSGAKTRLGFGVNAKPQRANCIHWDWHQSDKSQGPGDGVPR